MNAEQFSDINAMIQEDLATSRQLLALLEKETDASQTRNYDALALFLEQKTPLLEQLKKNAEVRTNWLHKLNQPADEKTWLSIINKNHLGVEQTELLEKWQEVKKTIEHCQRINTINGKLINRGVNSHSRLLQIMRGNLLKADLYNARGGKQSTALSTNVTQV